MCLCGALDRVGMPEHTHISQSRLMLDMLANLVNRSMLDILISYHCTTMHPVHGIAQRGRNRQFKRR
jgi:hypothetical protein